MTRTYKQWKKQKRNLSSHASRSRRLQQPVTHFGERETARNQGSSLGSPSLAIEGQDLSRAVRNQRERSPLKSSPLKSSVNSLARNINEYRYGEMLLWCFSAASLLIYIGLKWYEHLANVPRQPLLLTLFCTPIICYCSWRVWQRHR